MRRRWLVGGALSLLVAGSGLAGCSDGQEEQVVPTEAAIATAVVSTGAASAPTDVDAAPNVGVPSDRPDDVADAVEQMAMEFGFAPGAIMVVSVEDVTWPTADLGCPSEDPQSEGGGPTAGYRIVLAHESVELHYHGADGASPRRCDFADF